MKRIYITILFSICCIISLYPQDKTIIGFSFDSLANYHPLQIGNKWVYYESDDYLYYENPTENYVSREIVNDTIIDGKVYAVILNTKWYTNTISYEFLRLDSATLNIYSMDRLIDSLLCSDGMEPSNHLSFHSVYSYSIFGEVLPCREIQFFSDYFFRNRLFVFAYGLGLVEYSYDDLYYRKWYGSIVYAKINGKEYGTDPTIKIVDSLKNYHPLQVGNKWIYLSGWERYSSRREYGYTTSEIIKDTVIDGKEYAVFFINEKYNGSKHYDYLRLDTATLNVYSTSRLIDSLLCTNNHAVYEYPEFPELYISSGSINVLGKTIPARKVSPSLGGIMDYYEFNIYAYDIGSVSFGSGDGEGSEWFNRLVYAKINGTEYGENPLFKVIDSLAQYYPMNIGDKWTYRKIITSSNLNDTSLVDVTVVRDTILNSRYYKVFQEKNLKTDEISIYTERFDSTTANFFKNGIIEDNAFLNPDYSGRTYIFEDQKISLNGVTADSMFGLKTVKRNVSIWSNSTWLWDREFAWGFGLVYSQYRRAPDSIETYELIYAKFQNKEYTGVYENTTLIARTFQLNQNYPNPFNPSTTLSFSILSRAFVSLKIFDMLGREVTTIISEEMPAGNYTRQWNAGNMASGIYFYRLQAGSFTDTKKLILLK